MKILALVFALAATVGAKEKPDLRTGPKEHPQYICWQGEWAAVGEGGIFFADSEEAARYGAEMTGYSPIRFTRRNPHIKAHEKVCVEALNSAN